MRKAFGAGVLGPLLLWGLGCGPEPAPVAPAPDGKPELIAARPGLCFDLSGVAGGSTDRYRFAVAADEYLHFAVEQLGVDVTVTVADTHGRELLEVDTPTGTRGVEEVFLVAAAPGEVVLELRAWEGAEPDNRVQVRLEALRPATPRDRVRAAAARAYSDARRLRKGGSPEAAVERLQEAAPLWREAGDEDHLARTLFDLGTLQAADAHSRPASVGTLRRALELYRRLGNRRQEALTLAEMGDALLELDAWQHARRRYQASLALWRELGEPKQEAHTLNDLGVVAKRQGRLRGALEHYRRALALWRRLDLGRDEAITLGNLGALYALLGEHRQAHDHLHQALELLDPQRAPRRRAVTLTKLGDALLELGSPEAALERYREALDLRRRAGDRAGEAVTLNSIGRLHQRLGEPRPALEAFRGALDLLGQGEGADRSMVLDNFGIFYEGMGEVERARELFAAALDLARSVGYRRVEADALFGLARLARRRGRLDEARTLIEEALEVVESLRAASAGRQDLQSAFLATKQSYYDFLVDLLAEMHRRDPAAGHDAAAFAASERGRARGLLEALAEVRHQAVQGAEDLRRLAELREEVSLCHRERLRRIHAGADADEVRRLDLELRMLLDDVHEAEARVRRRRPRWRALAEPPVLSLEEVRSELPDDGTLLLKYHVTGERALLWAVDAGGATLFDLGGGRELRESARRAYAALTESHRATEAPRARLAAADLSRRALAPAAALLGRRRLLIAATDALQYVPFAALPKPRSPAEVDPRAPPLVVDHEIVQLPSASLLGVEPARRPPPAGRLAILADPVTAPDDERLDGERTPAAPGSAGGQGRPWPRLGFARREAEAILELAEGEETYAAFGFAARREAVLGGRVGGYRILHFATHGTLDAEHPELSALVLSRYRRDGREVDGYLRAYEIFNLDLAADLVVLSACRTALGKEVRGEGLVGLTHAFMEAGAARVVVSLWSVNDRATAELMESFYRGLLAEGLPAARALQAAQVSMWRGGRWQAPFYWAAFVVTGDGS